MKLQGTFVVLATAVVTTVFTVGLLAPSGVRRRGRAGQNQIADRSTTVPVARLRIRAQDRQSGLRGGRHAGDRSHGLQPHRQGRRHDGVGQHLARTPASLQSRMLPVPKTVWSHPYVFDLKPGASRRFPSPRKPSCRPDKNISISITDKNRAILATNLSTRKARRGGSKSARGPNGGL